MKTRQKIIIDKLIGTPLVYLVNITARLLGFILKLDHSLDKPFKTIVVSKYVGLGSIIQATPLLQTLRKKYPDANIIFITTSGGKTLLEHIPEVNQALTISDKSLWSVITTSFSLLRALWKLKPELFIDLEFYSNYSSIITTLSKAKNRLGFYKEDKAYRKGVYNYLVPFSVEVPISVTYLQFAKLVHCREIVSSLKIELSHKHWPQIEKKTGLVKGQKFIVINPNASDLRLERRWPKEYFVGIINQLLNDNHGYKIVLVGDKSEAPYVAEVEALLPNKTNLINTAGRLNLAELIELVGHANLMLTNDTGPMHIAFATRTKTISLFGPCSPQQYGGVDNAITFYKKMECSPCVHKYIIPPCKGDNQCMKRISEKEVREAVEKCLE